jgi:hypothetical protein
VATLTVVLLCAAALIAQSPALSDTADARRAAAEEFLKVVPVAEEIERLVHEMSRHVPEDSRAAFEREMLRAVDAAYVKQVMIDGLVGDLSAAELRAAAAFYRTPEGKAVREKLPEIIERISPVIQGELLRTARRLTQ